MINNVRHAGKFSDKDLLQVRLFRICFNRQFEEHKDRTAAFIEAAEMTSDDKMAMFTEEELENYINEYYERRAALPQGARTKDVAEMLGVSRKTLAYKAGQGEFGDISVCRRELEWNDEHIENAKEYYGVDTNITG